MKDLTVKNIAYLTFHPVETVNKWFNEFYSESNTLRAEFKQSNASFNDITGAIIVNRSLISYKALNPTKKEVI